MEGESYVLGREAIWVVRLEVEMDAAQQQIISLLQQLNRTATTIEELLKFLVGEKAKKEKTDGSK